MAYQVPPDIEKRVELHLATGQYSSADEVVREAFRALERQDDDLSAVKQALADMEAGDLGKPFDEFVDEFRRTNRISRET